MTKNVRPGNFIHASAYAANAATSTEMIVAGIATVAELTKARSIPFACRTAA
ncbi:hypothetical protein D3C83_284290 [compost metagenome]